jgi:hypothetical protein
VAIEGFISRVIIGRLLLFLQTDGFWREDIAMKSKTVELSKNLMKRSTAQWLYLKAHTATAGIFIRTSKA